MDAKVANKKLLLNWRTDHEFSSVSDSTNLEIVNLVFFLSTRAWKSSAKLYIYPKRRFSYLSLLFFFCIHFFVIIRKINYVRLYLKSVVFKGAIIQNYSLGIHWKSSLCELSLSKWTLNLIWKSIQAYSEFILTLSWTVWNCWVVYEILEGKASCLAYSLNEIYFVFHYVLVLFCWFFTAPKACWNS